MKQLNLFEKMLLGKKGIESLDCLRSQVKSIDENSRALFREILKSFSVICYRFFSLVLIVVIIAFYLLDLLITILLNLYI